MQDNNLFSCVKKKHRYPALDNSQMFEYPRNKLNSNYNASMKNLKWTGDITYIRTSKGWVYLAVVMDLFSRKIVGWSMSESINAELACNALKSAMELRKPSEEVLHHSDRGIQYSSDVFHESLDKYNMKCSMSATADPWSNACQESFFGKLKTEWIRGRVYNTHEEAKQDIFKYIEIFYNRHRRHAKLGDLSPIKFEEMKSK